MSVTILAIESSCDETSAAVCTDGKILSNFIAGQAVHEQYGGVVPELASRAYAEYRSGGGQGPERSRLHII